MGFNSDFENYPFLTGEEFAEVCHHLDRRYCQATLGPVRRQWKLRVCSALNTTFGLGPEYSTYIQIIRPLDGNLDDDELSDFLESLTLGGDLNERQNGAPHTETGLQDEIMEDEEADEVSTVPISKVPKCSLLWKCS